MQHNFSSSEAWASRKGFALWQLHCRDSLAGQPLRLMVPPASGLLHPGVGVDSDGEEHSKLVVVDRRGIGFLSALRLWRWYLRPEYSARRTADALGCRVLHLYLLWPSASSPRFAVPLDAAEDALRWMQQSGTLGTSRALSRVRFLYRFIIRFTGPILIVYDH